MSEYTFSTCGNGTENTFIEIGINIVSQINA